VSHRHNNRRAARERKFEGVAPAELLRQDFAALDAKVSCRCAGEVEHLLLVQSVEGHAHYGHGLFYGKTFPNTTVDDICRALKLDPMTVKEDRQELIDEVMELAARLIEGDSVKVACNVDGEPLLRCGTLRQIEIQPADLLRGLYAGGLRDDAAIRRRANRKYGVQMGYGECSLVDQRVLASLGLNGFDLARGSHEQEIERFQRAGLFAENGDGDVAYMYVRYQTGPGASDDAAICMAGRLWGISGAIGCFLADAVDTLEKYVPQYSDQDSTISRYVGDNFGDLGLTEEDAVDLAFLAHVPEDMQGRLPDSSLRHMLEIDRRTDQCALESHLAYVAGRPYSRMELDHGESDNVRFYQYIDSRFEEHEAKWR